MERYDPLSRHFSNVLRLLACLSVVFIEIARAHASAQELQCLQRCNQIVFPSTRLLNHMHFIVTRVAYACRVQSLRRPDAAEKGNNVALIAVHGVFEGSAAIAASERVTLIQ